MNLYNCGTIDAIFSNEIVFMVIKFFPLYFILFTGANDIEIEPKKGFTILQGTPVTFRCMKTIPGATFGWRVHLITGDTLFGSSAQNNLASLGMDIVYHRESTFLKFNATDRVVAVECLFTDVQTGKSVISNKINITTIGRWFC